VDIDLIQVQIFSLGILILAAYSGGLVAKKLKIGEVVGQILGGMFVGPHFIELIYKLFSIENSTGYFARIFNTFHSTTFQNYKNVFENFHFFVFMFLGLITFSLGEELHISRLKRVGYRVYFICLAQVVASLALVSGAFYFLFDFTLINSLIVGSIAVATAPALTFILMQKLSIEGVLRNLLVNILVVSDIIEVILFSIFLGIAIVIDKGESISFTHIFLEVSYEFIVAMGIGVVIYFVLKVMVKRIKLRKNEVPQYSTLLSTVLSEHPTPSVEVLLIMTGVVSVGIAVAISLDLPFLITAVTAGVLISNFHSHAIFDSLKIKNVMPIFNILFFAIIGSSVHIESFSTETIFYVMGYVFFRSSGKIFGTWFGCRVTGQDKKITACLPKLMLPHAGMAAVETIFVVTIFNSVESRTIFNTIFPALVIFELGGAWLSEKTLRKWKSWIVGEKDAERFDNKTARKGFSMFDLIKDRVVEINAHDKNDAIIKCAEFFSFKKIVSDSTIVINSALERERLGSTGVGNGIAFPHCRTGVVDDVCVACVILKNDVNWKSLDKKLVSLLFFVIAPEKKPEEHLKAVQTISYTLHTTDFTKDIVNAFESSEVESYLKSLEK